MREVVQFTAASRESVPYFTVGQPLDPRFLLVEAGIVGRGEAPPPPEETADSPVLGLLVAPDGAGLDLTGAGGQLLQLASPGFYEVRPPGDGGAALWVIAVNADVREADPARLDPEELLLAVAPNSTDEQSAVAQNPLSGDLTEGADPRALLEDGERRQGAWRFLLLGAMILLLGETLLAGRKKPLAKQVA